MKQSRSVRCFFFFWVLAESVVRLGDGTMGVCTSNSGPYHGIFVAFLEGFFYPINTRFFGGFLIGISHGGYVGPGVHPTIYPHIFYYTLMSQGLHDCLFFLVWRTCYSPISWESKGTPPYATFPPRNKAIAGLMIRDYEAHLLVP